jgi:2-polyprenyl-3-methyl-5-hydroxy-6-metoxy-1,4-benzoquinol methylase
MMRPLRRAIGALLPASVRAAMAAEATPAADSALAARVEYLEKVVRYLDYQVADQASLLRHLAAPVIADLPQVRQTKESFDFQWAEIPTGRYMLENEQFRREAPGYVTEFTQLPAEWFNGKSVIDAGCGLGRYSWALCTLGARVLSLDQSEHGLARTRAACQEFPSHRAMKVDLLHELPLTEPVDLVWSFGVLHHTGDTYGAFKHVAKWVKPGGMIFLMLYGKPREGHGPDYAAVSEYDEWRRRTRNMDLRAKLHAVQDHMRTQGFLVRGEEHIHGYFDAISPPINDLYVFEEVEAWLIEAGFEKIKQTVQTRNLHIVATRKAS